MESKFKVGDKVCVVNYGFILLHRKSLRIPKPDYKVYDQDDEFVYYDRMPGLVGKEGIVRDVGVRDGEVVYGLGGVEGG